VLKGEAGPHTGHCGEKTGEEGKMSHRGTKPSAKPAGRRKVPPRRRAGVQIKSANGWLPWDTGERDNGNTKVYRDVRKGKERMRQGPG